ITRRTLPRLPPEVLSPLSQPFCREADCLLDLYNMTSQPRPPGECLSCFYKLRSRAKGLQACALEPLRQWIEAHVEISVETEETEAATFPVALEEPDLESFCVQAMHRVREDTVIEAPEIRLQLRYRQERVPA
ncbi:MAG: hypothetical protein ACFB21_05185, partial [Opitutales bacterium]